jgi:hypothetical protein
MKTVFAAGDKSSWLWTVKKYFAVKSRLIIVLVNSIVQLAVYLGLHFGGVVVGGGEDGMQPHGEETDCYRLALLVNAGFVLFYMLGLGYFSGLVLKVADPFFLKVEVLSISTIMMPLIVVTVIYPIAPQVFGPQFDFRWIALAAVSCGFTFSVAIPLLVSFQPVEDWIERLSHRFRAWRGDFNSIIEMDPADEPIDLTQEVDPFITVLDNSTLFKAFMDFLVLNWCAENLLFYKEVESLQEGFVVMKPEERSEKAKRIFDEFVNPGAPLEINLEHGTRMNIVKAVTGGNLTVTTFKAAQKHIFELMKKDSFSKWQKTRECTKALKEASKKRGLRSHDRTSLSYLPVTNSRSGELSGMQDASSDLGNLTSEIGESFFEAV